MMEEERVDSQFLAGEPPAPGSEELLPPLAPVPECSVAHWLCEMTQNEHSTPPTPHFHQPDLSKSPTE